MDRLLGYLATSREDEGALLFLAYNLGQRASTEVHGAALRFCTRGLPDSPEPAALLDFVLGLYVLCALGMHNFEVGRRRAFSLEVLTRQVDAALESFGWGEMLGFDEPEDDEDLCDAVVWLFVLERAGLRAFDDWRPRIWVALEHLRLNYGMAEDRNAWQWTSYLVTHVVYVKSAWGLQPPSEPCLEEFTYITTNLPRALAHEDVELVGEFLHCLRVLGQLLDGKQQALVQRGRALLSRPHDGLWRSKRVSFYTKYHSAWCIAVGLGE